MAVTTEKANDASTTAIDVKLETTVEKAGEVVSEKEAAPAATGEAAVSVSVTATAEKQLEGAAADGKKDDSKKDNKKKEEKDAPLKASVKAVEKPVQPDFEIRYHPKLPYTYEVKKYGEIYSVVERLGRPKESRGSFIKGLKQRYRNYRTLWPLFFRFSRETIGPLGKRRILCYLIGNILLKLIPSWQYSATWELTEITRKALETRVLDKAAMLKAVSVDIIGYVLEKMLEGPLEENKARLQYRFRSLVRQHILKAHIRFDSITSSDEKVKGKIRAANQLLAYNWRQAFLLELISKIVADTSGLVSEGLLVYKMARTHGSVAALSFASNLLFGFRSFIRSGAFWKTEFAITDEKYRRMTTMGKLSERAGAQDQLLGLRGYYLAEHRKAVEALGDVGTREPDVYSEAWRSPVLARFFEVLRRGNDNLLYIMFALQAIARPKETGADAAAAMSDLYLLRDSTSRFSRSIFDVLESVAGIVKVGEPIRQYYGLDEIKPKLKLRADPIPYRSIAGTLDVVEAAAAAAVTAVASGATAASVAASQAGDDDAATLVEGDNVSQPMSRIESNVTLVADAPLKRTGMRIEFRNVSFKYPHQKKPALDDVSFTIEAGELCSIVGFSGSGKSSLIALLVRLHDPDSGTILINNEDITAYDPEELYQKISMLFQVTPKTDVNIREFIRMGRIDATDEEIEEAVEASGATEIIGKLKYGYDTELQGQGWWGTAVSVDQLMKRAHHMDEWEEKYFGEYREEDHDKDDDDKEVDETTDEQTRLALIAAIASLNSVILDSAKKTAATPSAKELQKRLARAIKTKLPDIHPSEKEILADSYDPNAEDESSSDENAKFSGGEWAKVVMARSFLRKDVDLLILDEFSAALDPMSEADIFKKFLLKRSRMTMIAVTHRFHLAARSDRILFMKKGKVLENGTHQELMKLNGEYATMYRETSSAGANSKEVAIQTEEVEEEQAGEKEDASDSTAGAPEERAAADSIEASQASLVVIDEPASSAIDTTSEVAASRR